MTVGDVVVRSGREGGLEGEEEGEIPNSRVC